MDQDLSHWLHKHQDEVQQRWWQVARKEDLVAESLLQRLAQEDAVGLGSFRLRMLACVAADRPLTDQAGTLAPHASAGSTGDDSWLEALAQELKQSELLALLSALRQALFEILAQVPPQQLPERWSVISRRLDRIALDAVNVYDVCLADVDKEREHWQDLYNITRELNASLDLSYVLQKAITRIIDELEAGRGAVLLLDQETRQVTPQATQNWPDMRLDLADMPQDWQRGYGSYRVLKHGSAKAGGLEALVQDENETVVAAPLLANGQFQGVLAVATRDADGFHPLQLDLVEAVVNHMATSVGNAQVQQTLNTQARELGLLLRQQQEESSKNKAILASIADGVVVNDRRGRIIMVNHAAELILDAQAETLIGHDLKSLFKLFTAGAREDILKAMTAILSDPTVQVAPEMAQTMLEIDNRTINAHLAPVMTERREFLGIVTIFRDITKEVEADRAKSDFVSTVSHELRTPMTAIKGYTDLIYSKAVGEINDNQKRFLGIIKNNTDRLTALINDLLDISRVETGRVRFEPETLLLGDVVKNVIEALATNAENREQVLNYRIEAGLPEIKGDPNRLTQVFTNLVGNAINYTPEGGEISVNVYSVEGAVRADVTDDGIGISPDDLGKVFERFYRADHPVVQESRGTGLGLPIVKMFVEMHGGRVWADSELDRGSTFTVILPLPTVQQKEEGLEQIWSEATVNLQKRLVLVADDDPDIAELVKLHLEQVGYQTIVAGRGVQVLEIARREHPDLIVLDILLPDMDGRAVLETLKSEPHTSDIPVLILSIVADDGDAFDLGAAGYLTKPIDEQELLGAVRAAFARRGRILVVEDDVDTIEMMRLALRRVGYTVDIAAEGYEALSLARRWRPQAILLDLRLPGMDGYEALTHLKRSPITQDIPIIVTSAHVVDTSREDKRLKGLGVLGFLPKPFTVNQLVAEIDKVTGDADKTKGD
jgi:PAS domain S-box-containing protein